MKRTFLAMLLLWVAGSCIADHPPEPSVSMSVRLESVTGNRTSLTNDVARNLYQGWFKVEISKLANVRVADDSDLACAWSLRVEEGRFTPSKYRQDFTWTMEADFEIRTVKDGVLDGLPVGSLVYRGTLRAPAMRREQVLNKLGGVKSGFAYKCDADVQGLMAEPVRAVADDLATLLTTLFKGK